MPAASRPAAREYDGTRQTGRFEAEVNKRAIRGASAGLGRQESLGVLVMARGLLRLEPRPCGVQRRRKQLSA
jgi:hypothetical protein